MTREKFRAVDVLLFVFGLFLLLGNNASADSGNGSSSSAPPPMQSEFSNFKPLFQPSIAVIVIVLISAFFFIGFFSIYLRQCTNDGESVRRQSLPRLGFSRRGPHGFEPAVIESFPTFVYSTVKALKIGQGSLECAVCLSEFEDDETLRLLPHCSHAFHPECIDAWLASHVTCPVCRADLQADPGEFAGEYVTIDIPVDHDVSENQHSGHAGASSTQNQVANQVTDDPQTPNPVATTPPRKSLRFMPEFRLTKMRTKSIRKFSRSHSTGHSPVPPESHERFTLCLPENVRRQLISSGRMNRVASCSSLPVDTDRSSRGRRVGEGSSRVRRSLRGTKEDSTKSDGWTFSIAPPFIYRSFSTSTPSSATAQSAERDPPSPKPAVFPKTLQSPKPPVSPKPSHSPKPPLSPKFVDSYTANSHSPDSAR